MRPCAHCGAPIKYVRTAGGWLHTQPLAEFRLGPWEAAAIHADPPRAGEFLHHQTYIHPAQPG